jgi:hypothetical protein
MPAGRPKGQKKMPSQGRKKGTPNKRSWDIVHNLEKLGFDPAAKLVQLTLDAEAEFKKHRRRPQDAAPYLATASNGCAKLMRFVYPERRAVDVTSGGDKLTSLADIFASVISGNGADTSDKK